MSGITGVFLQLHWLAETVLPGYFFTPDKSNWPIRRTNLDLWLKVKVAFPPQYGRFGYLAFKVTKKKCRQN